MTAFDSLSTTQKIRASLHRDVRSICTETCHFLGLEIAKPAMDIISELVYKKIAVYGLDLEAFAKHAKRTVINSEDVKLLVRRNPSLKTHLNISQPTASKPAAAKDKRRKTVAPPVKQPETPISKVIEKSNQAKIEKEKEEERTTMKDDAFENMDVSDMIDLTFD